MSAKDLIDGVRRDVSLPLPLARYRDLIARLAFGRPYSAIIAAERAGELAAPAIHESDLPELTRVFEKHVPALVVAVRAHIAIYRGRHQLTSVAIPILTNGIYLTAYWRNRSAPHQSREEGRETLQINLSKPLTELLKRQEFRTTPNVRGFRFEAEDHLECQADFISQGLARRTLLAAAGTLKFLDATGLRPVTRYAQLTDLRIEKLPGLDHRSDWVDPSTNAWVLIDEPYRNVDSIARAAWIEGNGLHMIAPDWGACTGREAADPTSWPRTPSFLIGSVCNWPHSGKSRLWFGQVNLKPTRAVL